MNFPPTTKKAAAGYLPHRVFSPPRRLTSEFGMGSGVSAWLSPPPPDREHVLRKPNAIVLSLVRRNCATNRFGGPPSPFGEKWRSPRAIGATWLCTLPCLHRSSIERVTCPCPYPLAGWEAYCRERLRA